MNTLNLTETQQAGVVQMALRIMRERVLGHVAMILHRDDEFLARPPEDRIIKGGAEELETLSVSMCIVEAVHYILRDIPRSDRPPICVENDSILRKLASVMMDEINKPREPKIALPPRLREAFEICLEKNEVDISEFKAKIRQSLTQYFYSKSQGERKQLFILVNDLLTHMYILQQKNNALEATYELSPGIETVQTDSTTIPVHDFLWDGGGEGRSIDRYEDTPPEAVFTYQESISLSPAENYLRGYLPAQIQSYEELFQETYYCLVDEDVPEKDSFTLQQFPDKQREMIELVLMRKLIIYMYAENGLRIDEKAKAEPITMGIKKQSLVILEKEIDNCYTQIDAIKGANSAGVVATSPEEIKSNLEQILGELHEEYRSRLEIFIDSPEDQTQEITDIEKSIIRVYGDLVGHCERHGLESRYIGTAIANEENTRDGSVMTIDELLDDMSFFDRLPEVLTDPVSDSEKMLRKVCDIHLENGLSHHLNGIEEVAFHYNKTDEGNHTVSDMETFEEVLNMVLQRKMMVYFHAMNWSKINQSDRVEKHLHSLWGEIQTVQTALKMLTRRIDWAKGNDKYKSTALQEEIETIESIRYATLHAFIGNSPLMQEIAGGKIVALSTALQQRRDELFDMGHVSDDNYTATEPWLYSEVHLAKYVLPDIRNGETVLFGKQIPFDFDNGKSGLENRHEKEKIKLKHRIERMMMLYFFGTRRIREIDNELKIAGKNETLSAERAEIESHTNTLRKIILEDKNKLDTMMPREPTTARIPDYVAIYYKAGQILSKLDGLITHADRDERMMVSGFWERISKQVCKFQDSLKQETSSFKLKKLQQEYHDEMQKIVQDIERYLLQMVTKRKPDSKIGSLILGEVRAIMAELFTPH